MPLNLFHGDTTSMSLYGAYNRPTDALNITYGYSRDQAGMKQIQFGLIGNQDCIPFYADVHDGNTSDKNCFNTFKSSCSNFPMALSIANSDSY